MSVIIWMNKREAIRVSVEGPVSALKLCVLVNAINSGINVNIPIYFVGH